MACVLRQTEIVDGLFLRRALTIVTRIRLRHGCRKHSLQAIFTARLVIPPCACLTEKERRSPRSPSI